MADQNLARRSTQSALWSTATSTLRLLVYFVRTFILMRLIPDPVVWGTFGTALLFMRLSIHFPNFGLNWAFLHRAKENEDADRTMRVFFTLRVIFYTFWALLAFGITFFLKEIPLRDGLRIFIALYFVRQTFLETGRMVLTRQVLHKRLGMMYFAMAVTNAGVAVWLALRGETLKALIYPEIATTIVSLIIFYAWKPVWQPRFLWDKVIVRYLLTFGRRNMMAAVLMVGLDNVDDLFVTEGLGRDQFGFYGRAYAYATYPRQLLAGPINAVAGGTYAALKGDRERLSKVFFRVIAMLLRAGFLLGGIFFVVAPEFIRIFPGEAWLDMLLPLRLMLIFTILDPVKASVGHLFIAVGKPETVVRARLVQLVVMVVLLFALGLPFGNAGVAVAVDIMLLVGLGLLFYQIGEHVDYNFFQLFGSPTIGLTVTLITIFGLLSRVQLPDSPYISAAVKIVIFVAIYGISLVLLEGRRLLEMATTLFRAAFQKKGAA